MAARFRTPGETRRAFLHGIGASVATWVVGCSGSSRAGSPGAGGAAPDGSASSCIPTTADIEGPYYRPGIPVRSELDLYGDPGERLRLSGVVLDVNCEPIQNATVEIWNSTT